MLSLRLEPLVCLTGVLLLLYFLLLLVDIERLDDFLLAFSKCVTDEEFKEIKEDDEHNLLLTRTRLFAKLVELTFEFAIVAVDPITARRLFSSLCTRPSVLIFSLLNVPSR